MGSLWTIGPYNVSRIKYRRCIVYTKTNESRPLSSGVLFFQGDRTLLSSASSKDLQTLTHFYGEVLSPYLWHAGMAGFSALLICRQWKPIFG